jgi:AcrR family transcriptional regulator
MSTKKSLPKPVSRDDWAARIAALDKAPAAPRKRKEPVTIARIVSAALTLVEAEGFDALTMRRVAAGLDVTPGALYAHVRDKVDLDDLMFGELCSRVVLPAPDPAQWQAQILHVCRQLCDQYLRYPGIARAALAAAPRSLDTLRINEGMLSILLAAGAAPGAAAWATDAAFQYTAAYSIAARRRHSEDDPADRAADRAEVIERFRMLPLDRFPITVTYAEEITSGDDHERFDSAVSLLFSGLVLNQQGPYEH